MATSEANEAEVAAAERIAAYCGGDPDAEALDLVRLALGDGTTVTDAIAGLQLMGRASSELRDVEAGLIGVARDCGATWRVIAEALGLGSQQAAQARYKASTGQIPSKASYISLDRLVSDIAAATEVNLDAVYEEVVATAAALGIRTAPNRPTLLTAIQARQIEGQAVASINRTK